MANHRSIQAVLTLTSALGCAEAHGGSATSDTHRRHVIVQIMDASLRPSVARVAAGYQSEPITGEVEKVMLPCPLEPDSYSYEVRLFETGDDQDQQHSGRIQRRMGSPIDAAAYLSVC